MEKFDRLYDKMSRSKDVNDMRLFGRVLREAMEYIAASRSEKAEGLLEQLCAIEWNNYLTKKEAEEIVNGMAPAAKWSEEQMVRGLEEMGLAVEEEGSFNKHALWAVVSMRYSDDGRTIAEHIFKNDAPDDLAMLRMCYYLALDVLEDEDGVFNVRRYFGLE